MKKSSLIGLIISIIIIILLFIGVFIFIKKHHVAKSTTTPTSTLTTPIPTEMKIPQIKIPNLNILQIPTIKSPIVKSPIIKNLQLPISKINLINNFQIKLPQITIPKIKISQIPKIVNLKIPNIQQDELRDKYVFQIKTIEGLNNSLSNLMNLINSTMTMTIGTNIQSLQKLANGNILNLANAQMANISLLNTAINNTMNSATFAIAPPAFNYYGAYYDKLNNPVFPIKIKNIVVSSVGEAMRIASKNNAFAFGIQNGEISITTNFNNSAQEVKHITQYGKAVCNNPLGETLINQVYIIPWQLGQDSNVGGDGNTNTAQDIKRVQHTAALMETLDQQKKTLSNESKTITTLSNTASSIIPTATSLTKNINSDISNINQTIKQINSTIASIKTTAAELPNAIKQSSSINMNKINTIPNNITTLVKKTKDMVLKINTLNAEIYKNTNNALTILSKISSTINFLLENITNTQNYVTNMAKNIYNGASICQNYLYNDTKPPTFLNCPPPPPPPPMASGPMVNTPMGSMDVIDTGIGVGV